MVGSTELDEMPDGRDVRAFGGPDGTLTVEVAVVADRRGDRASTVLSLAGCGELVYGTADHLVALISEYLPQPGTVGRVDLHAGDVTFCDSHGIAQLVRAKNVAARKAAGFRIVEPSRQLRRILELTGLADLLRVTSAAAARSTSARPGGQVAANLPA